MKSTEDQDSSDIAFDEVRERPLAPPEVGIYPDGPSVYLKLSLEEEASKVDEIPSTNSENSQQTENNPDFKNQDSNTSEIDINDNLTGLTEFWELVGPMLMMTWIKFLNQNFHCTMWMNQLNKKLREASKKSKIMKLMI